MISARAKLLLSRDGGASFHTPVSAWQSITEHSKKIPIAYPYTKQYLGFSAFAFDLLVYDPTAAISPRLLVLLFFAAAALIVSAPSVDVVLVCWVPAAAVRFTRSDCCFSPRSFNLDCCCALAIRCLAVHWQPYRPWQRRREQGTCFIVACASTSTSPSSSDCCCTFCTSASLISSSPALICRYTAIVICVYISHAQLSA